MTENIQSYEKCEDADWYRVTYTDGTVKCFPWNAPEVRSIHRAEVLPKYISLFAHFAGVAVVAVVGFNLVTALFSGSSLSRTDDTYVETCTGAYCYEQLQ